MNTYKSRQGWRLPFRLPQRQDFQVFREGPVVLMVAVLMLVSIIFARTIFAPLIDLFGLAEACHPKNEFHEKCAQAALAELTKKPYGALQNDQFIIKVNDREVLCRVTTDKGQGLHYFAGLIPYRTSEDSAGPVLDSSQREVGRKVVLRFSSHGGDKFHEFVKNYLAAPDGAGNPVFEDFESYEDRAAKQKEAQQEAVKAAREQAKQEEDSKIRRI